MIRGIHYWVSFSFSYLFTTKDEINEEKLITYYCFNAMQTNNITFVSFDLLELKNDFSNSSIWISWYQSFSSQRSRYFKFLTCNLEYIIFIWGEYLTLSMACTNTLCKVHQSSPFIKSSPSLEIENCWFVLMRAKLSNKCLQYFYRILKIVYEFLLINLLPDAKHNLQWVILWAWLLHYSPLLKPKMYLFASFISWLQKRSAIHYF